MQHGLGGDLAVGGRRPRELEDGGEEEGGSPKGVRA